MTTNDLRSQMASIGAHVKRIRVFLGLTQEQLAQAANVSQGAVSRLEGARGLQTPYLIVMRVQRLLCDRLRALDPDVPLASDLVEWLNHPSMLPMNDAPGGSSPLTADPDLRSYLEAYRRLPETARPKVLAIIDSLSAIVPGARAAATGA